MALTPSVAVAYFVTNEKPKMTSAFIVNLNLDTLENLPELANEIADDLSSAGFDVISVAPWTHPSLQLSTVPPQTTQQTQTDQTNING